MKKVILSAAVIILMVAVKAKSETVNIPRMDSIQGVQSADYGGVDVSTSNFSASTVVVSGEALLYGVCFSSGISSDYVDFRDSGTIVGAIPNNLVLRLYNTATSTVSVSGSNLSAGCVNPSKPMRFKNGIWWVPIQSNGAAYNHISVLYYLRRKS